MVWSLVVMGLLAVSPAVDLADWSTTATGVQVDAAAGFLTIGYQRPEREPFQVGPAQPVPLPAEATRLRLWVGRASGDADLELVLRDATGREWWAPLHASRPTFPDIRRRHMRDWSRWHQCDSVALQPPADWLDRVAPEFLAEARRVHRPAPFTLVGLRVSPARDRRDNDAYDEQAAIQAGEGELLLTGLDWLTHDGLAATEHAWLADRWRWTWAGAIPVFPDDLTRGSGRRRYRIEVRAGYQGVPVWAGSGEFDLDREDLAGTYRQRLELPALPAGRYQIVVHCFTAAGVLDLTRDWDLFSLAGPAELPPAPPPAPLRWADLPPERVWPAATTSVGLRLLAEADRWPGARIRLRVVDWRQRQVLDELRDLAADQTVTINGLGSGTDYQVTAEVVGADRQVLEQAVLHCGVASRRAEATGAVPPVPSRDELLASGQAVPVAELFGDVLSTDWPDEPLTEARIAEVDGFIAQAVEHEFPVLSFHFGWGETEPLPGVYRFDELHRRVGLAAAAGRQVLLTPAAWGARDEYPRWESYQPMLDQHGRVCTHSGAVVPGYHDPVRRAGYGGWLQAVASEFRAAPAVIGYRVKAHLYESANRPEFTRTDHSPLAQAAYTAWRAERGLSPEPLAALRATPGTAPARCGPDLSPAWSHTLAFRIAAYRAGIEHSLASLRAVDPVRQIHVYRGPHSMACEEAIDLLADGAEYHDEGGPFYFQRFMGSLAGQAGVPYTNEGHQFTPPSRAMVDAGFFYGGMYQPGWSWLYRWNTTRSADRRFAALPEVLDFIAASQPALAAWAAAAEPEPEVLVFGSRADRLTTDGQGFYSYVTGLDTYTALFSYHQLPAHFATEYADWIDLSRFKLVIAQGQVLAATAVERLAGYVADGGRLALVGEVGNFTVGRPAERRALAGRLAGAGEVRQLAPADQEPPPPGAVSQAPRMFASEVVDQVLEWAGVERMVRAEAPGWEVALRREAGGAVLVAAFRHFPGSYDNVWYDEQVARRWPAVSSDLIVPGLVAGRWRVERLHRTPLQLGEVTATAAGLRFTAPPAQVSELQIFRLSPVGR